MIQNQYAIFNRSPAARLPNVKQIISMFKPVVIRNKKSIHIYLSKILIKTLISGNKWGKYIHL